MTIRNLYLLAFVVLLLSGPFLEVFAQGNRRHGDYKAARYRDNEEDDDTDYYHGRNDRVLFEKVTALTFRRGDYTTGRRSSSIPALQCVGGSAKSLKDQQPEVVQCTRVGFDGSDAQWKCEADLSTDVKFGEVDVSCEGYAYPEDVYILKGSCGLKYNLDLTDAGKQRKKYDETHPNRGPIKTTEYISTSQNEEGVWPLLPSSSGFSLWSLLKWGFYASLFMSLFFGYSIFRWVISLVFLPITLPFKILGWLLGGLSSASTYQHQPYGAYQGYGGSGNGGLADLLGSYFTTPKVYQAPASGGGFWSGIFYGGLAGSLLGRWLSSGRSRPQQQSAQPVKVVRVKEDPRDKRPEPATSRVAAGYGGTSRR